MSPLEARIRQRHEVVHTLLAQGHGIREIAWQLHCTQRTVQNTARAATPEQLLTGRHQPRPSQLDSFKAHLDRCWAEGRTLTRPSPRSSPPAPTSI
jgi:transposase